MDSDYNIDYEPKGRYYKFETGAKGAVVLKPVKVPAHVLAERKEQFRKKEIQRNVVKNRERAASMNIGFIFFMTIALGICGFVCYIYISLQGEVASQMTEVAALEQQLEESVSDNDAYEKRIDASQNLKEIKEKADRELGMTAADPGQIKYYSVASEDYMLQYQDIEETD